ncbi:protein DMP7-like [Apium graveolens]|uniref:protein DMP7-like n=1 Tax=Apium graveolens TaxID=4045 RepID=UPI003D7BD56F
MNNNVNENGIGVNNVTTMEEQLQPLLDDHEPPGPSAEKPLKTPAQKVMRKAFKRTALLANLLPTGSVLAFNMLSPAFTHEGTCPTAVNKTLTLVLLGLCTVSCFFLCFTDSFRDERGKVRYGVATINGLWIVDCSVKVPPEEGEKYRIRFLDFVHGFISMLVFGAVAMFDQNTVKCLYPMPSEEEKELLATLPLAVGLICSMFFICFPSQRHGIGFPLSRH